LLHAVWALSGGQGGQKIRAWGCAEDINKRPHKFFLTKDKEGQQVKQEARLKHGQSMHISTTKEMITSMTSPNFGGSLPLEKKFSISPSGKPECEFICFILCLH
tara:strand:+ start:72 stop:383 length:312 start_codon:yes stop_codon:yes gene_type:complete